jgi:hypothetical protein
MATLIASNQSAVFIRTQGTLGTFANPTTLNADGTGGVVGTYAIRVVGTPTWAVRGAGIIDRKEIYTPWGGNSSSRTGGLGWDITFQTEFFWQFGLAYDLDLSTQTQLAALWLSSPWAITHPALATQLAVQPFFQPDVNRTTTTYAVQPFSMVYEEESGKRWEAFDCVALPKFSWEYGQRVMIDWTIKGSWRPVIDSSNVQPTYVVPATQPPIIGVNCAAAFSGLTVEIDAVSKVTIDTGWTLNDVGDFRKAYGFGISFFRQDASPSIELDINELPETKPNPGTPPPANVSQQPGWTDAEANTIGNSLTLTMTVGSSAWTIVLDNPQYVAFPTQGGETNGYRTNTSKWQAIPSDSTSPLIFTMTTSN